MHIGNYKITVREIIFSVIIVCLLLVPGLFISDKISDHLESMNEVYNQALKIDNDELFQHAYNTSAGNAFTKVHVEASESQVHPDIYGEYMYIERVYEEEHHKTKLVTRTHTDSKGKTYTTTETVHYWEWDVEQRDELSSDRIKLNGIEIPREKVSGINVSRLHSLDEVVTGNLGGQVRPDYIYMGSHKRYSYYVIPKDIDMTGYLRFGVKELLPPTSSSSIELSYETDVSKLYNSYLSGPGLLIAFWSFWIVLIAFTVCVFVLFDNKWIEDKQEGSI